MESAKRESVEKFTSCIENDWSVVRDRFLIEFNAHTIDDQTSPVWDPPAHLPLPQDRSTLHLLRDRSIPRLLREDR